MTCARCGQRLGEWLDDGDWSCICGAVTYRTAALPLVEVRLPTYGASKYLDAQRQERHRKAQARQQARAARRQAIAELHGEGMTAAQIARHLGISRRTVFR